MARSKDSIDFGPLPDLVGYALRRAQLAVFKDFMQAFLAEDIRPTQYGVLTVIERNPGLTQSQVAEALGIKRANFVPLLDGLEARGLAERRPAAGDRRSYALTLTQAGEAMMARLHAINRNHEGRITAALGPDGYRQLLELLGRVVEALGDGTSGDVSEDEPSA